MRPDYRGSPLPGSLSGMDGVEHIGSTAVPGLDAKPIIDIVVCVPDVEYWQRRHVVFRDWLRISDEDRELYRDAKRELAAREWPTMNDYAAAKSAVIHQIMGRAEAWADARADPDTLRE